jgi:hypothetical protein
MRGAIPPLPQHFFMAWHLVKPRDNFTFLYNLVAYILPRELSEVDCQVRVWGSPGGENSSRGLGL